MVLALATLTVSAQKIKLDDVFRYRSDHVTVEGDLTVLKGITGMQVVEDLSKITIAGLDVDHWLTFRQTEQPDYSAKNEWEHELKPLFKTVLLPFANQRLMKQNFMLSEEIESDVYMVVQPQNIGRKGNCVINCYIRKKGSDDNLASLFVTGRGGVFGTMSNLWGDGLKDAGNAMGKFLARYLIKLNQ